MKKIKKILSLACASLVMGGLIFSAPKNTTTANAEIYRAPYREKYYQEPQQKINGKYHQRVSFKFRSKDFPHSIKGFYRVEAYVGDDGYLKLRKYDPIGSKYFGFDDAYMMIVTDENNNERFKWLSNYKPQPTDSEEMDYFIKEFNKLKVGLGNHIILVPRYWNGTIVFNKDGVYSALKKIGYNNWGKGYTDKAHKYTTSLRVDNDGLQEIKGCWGSEGMFTYP